MEAGVPLENLDYGDHRHRKFIWLLPCGFLLASAASLRIDIQLLEVFKQKQLPALIQRPLDEWLEICESFGHGFGAFLIVIAVWVLSPGSRRYWPWMLGSCWGSGMLANAVKALVRRTRPRDFDLAIGSVWKTFSQAASPGMPMQSFPSAHTATAVGLAVMLSTLFPRGRWFFSMMAALVGMQRIVSVSHFPSDVFAGAFVGWLMGTACSTLMFESSHGFGRHSMLSTMISSGKQRKS